MFYIKKCIVERQTKSAMLEKKHWQLEIQNRKTAGSQTVTCSQKMTQPVYTAITRKKLPLKEKIIPGNMSVSKKP